MSLEKDRGRFSKETVRFSEERVAAIVFKNGLKVEDPMFPESHICLLNGKAFEITLDEKRKPVKARIVDGL